MTKVEVGKVMKGISLSLIVVSVPASIFLTFSAFGEYFTPRYHGIMMKGIMSMKDSLSLKKASFLLKFAMKSLLAKN